MIFRRQLCLFLLLPNLLVSVGAKTQSEYPKPVGWVNDFANVMDADAKTRLSAICAEVDQRTHAQIALVTVDSTNGTPIDNYALLLFNKWGIGHKEDNRGILILLAIKDRKYRIEVSRGFEPLFSNDRVASIGAKMIPDLRERRYQEAVLRTVDVIARIIASEKGVRLSTVGPDPSP